MAAPATQKKKKVIVLARREQAPPVVYVTGLFGGRGGVVKPMTPPGTHSGRAKAELKAFLAETIVLCATRFLAATGVSFAFPHFHGLVSHDLPPCFSSATTLGMAFDFRPTNLRAWLKRFMTHHLGKPVETPPMTAPGLYSADVFVSIVCQVLWAIASLRLLGFHHCDTFARNVLLRPLGDASGHVVPERAVKVDLDGLGNFAATTTMHVPMIGFQVLLCDFDIAAFDSSVHGSQFAVHRPVCGLPRQNWSADLMTSASSKLWPCMHDFETAEDLLYFAPHEHYATFPFAPIPLTDSLMAIRFLAFALQRETLFAHFPGARVTTGGLARVKAAGLLSPATAARTGNPLAAAHTFLQRVTEYLFWDRVRARTSTCTRATQAETLEALGRPRRHRKPMSKPKTWTPSRSQQQQSKAPPAGRRTQAAAAAAAAAEEAANHGVFWDWTAFALSRGLLERSLSPGRWRRLFSKAEERQVDALTLCSAFYARGGLEKCKRSLCGAARTPFPISSNLKTYEDLALALLGRPQIFPYDVESAITQYRQARLLAAQKKRKK